MTTLQVLHQTSMYLWIIWSLSLTVSAGPVVSDKKRVSATEFWLESEDAQNDDPFQAAQRGHAVSTFQCPPPPKKVLPFGCYVRRCSSDRECQTTNKDQGCCYNGCIFACMAAISPPPVVDWLREPPRRLYSGNSWLVPGPAEPLGGKIRVESCSTPDLPQEGDALLCPHGFICHIEHTADPKQGIPDRGRCIRTNSDTVVNSATHFRLKTNKHNKKDVCIFDDRIYRNRATFYYFHHPCTCHEGEITCKVGRKT